MLYEVHPRYTAGSPAQVDATTAERVAVEEGRAYADLLAAKDPKALEGLGGIVVRWNDHRFHRYYVDMLTQERWHIRLAALRAS